jgi:FtsZ-binding cell division protein ZapB
MQQLQHLQSLSLLEERIQAAVELITYLKGEKRRLESETSRLLETQRGLERQAKNLEDQVELLQLEKDELATNCETLRAKQEDWQRFESDREEIRVRIDSMLAKFEELEV